jgi:hypothetical protein
MVRLRAYVVIGLMALLGVSSGCWSAPKVQLTAETLAGEYFYYSADKGEPHDPDRLTLKPDGTYALVHMTGGRAGSVEAGRWQVLNDFQPRVAFGSQTYPVEIRGKHVRLMINQDLGHWYETTKD